jgi:predicted kinase
MRFSLDDYRSMCGNGKETWTNERENAAVDALIASAKVAINAGLDICIDNTHLVPRLPRRYRKELSPLGVCFKVHDFTHVTVDECIARDLERAEPVGEAVIRKMAARHADATKKGWRLTDEWMNSDLYIVPKPYEGHPSLPSVVLCDIDGTVAIHGDERGHYEYEKVLTDKPNPAIVQLVRDLAENVGIIFLSGREDRCRLDTEEWLWGNGLSDGDAQLFMRTTGDHRPDYIVKAELFDAHVRDWYNVDFVLDDRDQVVKMWREMGLTCLQVAPGSF